jgi:surfeit locus 1 family protein
VPDARKLPDSRSEGQIPGEVEVRGLLRPAAKPAFFAPANDASHNIWYWPDLMGMSASAFPAGSPVETLPFAIEADASPTPPGGLPQGGVTRLTLPNRHLEYAVTWFGLALTLIGVYFAFAVNRLKSARDGE